MIGNHSRGFTVAGLAAACYSQVLMAHFALSPLHVDSGHPAIDHDRPAVFVLHLPAGVGIHLTAASPSILQ